MSRIDGSISVTDENTSVTSETPTPTLTRSKSMKEKIDELKGEDDEISHICRAFIYVFFIIFMIILLGNFLIGCIIPGDYSYMKFIKFINIFISVVLILLTAAAFVVYFINSYFIINFNFQGFFFRNGPKIFRISLGVHLVTCSALIWFFFFFFNFFSILFN
jgi:hypothetical protein